MRALISLGVVVCVLAATAGTAHAAQLKLTGTTLFYLDTDPNAHNVVTVKLSSDGKGFTVTDTGRTGRNTIPITSDGSCTINRGTGTCPAAGVTLVDVQTGDQDDTITQNAAVASHLAGGAGNDRITARPADDGLR